MLKPEFLPKMLMIGGSSRNVGKTALICAILRKFTPTTPIIGLKVTSIRPGEQDFHGNHASTASANFEIIEESGLDNRKDTTRMLQAGARKVYFIQSTDALLPLAMEAFFKIEVRNSLIICETRSLRNLIKPGLFILINGIENNISKENWKYFSESADLLLNSDAEKRSVETYNDRIGLNDKGWYLVQ